MGRSPFGTKLTLFSVVLSRPAAKAVWDVSGRVEERRGCLGHAASLRFLSPLIEPDMQISSIRLSDKTSRLRPRLVVAKSAQTYEPEVPVKVREWIGPALASPDFVLEAATCRAVGRHPQRRSRPHQLACQQSAERNPLDIDERGNGISHGGDIVAFEAQNYGAPPRVRRWPPMSRSAFASRGVQTRPPPVAAPRTRSISAIEC